MTTFMPARLTKWGSGVPGLLLVRSVAAFLLASLPVNLAAGQDKGRLNPTHLSMEAYDEKNAHPSQMEKLIVALAGEWTTGDTYEGSDRTLRGRREHSRESYRVGPARLSLIEEYHGGHDAGKPLGAGIFWWDDRAKGVHVLWCDSDALDNVCRVLSGSGNWEGNNFVLTDVQGDSGKRVFVREVWSDLKRDSFTQTVYQGIAADKLQKILTIKATRVQARLHP